MNVKTRRHVNDYMAYYHTPQTGNKPVQIFYLGMEEGGSKYTRSEYILLDLIAKVGGFFGTFYNLFFILVLGFSWFPTHIQMIKMFVRSE